MRTGAHMADTGTEHNIELIVGVRVQLLSTPMTVTTLAKLSMQHDSRQVFCFYKCKKIQCTQASDTACDVQTAVLDTAESRSKR